MKAPWQRTKNKKKNKKISNWITTHKIVVPLLFIVLFAGLGAWQIIASKAAVVDRGTVEYMSTSEGCWLAGRVWDNGSCLKRCRNSGSNFVAATNDHLGYCSGAIATSVGLASCTNLGRRYVNNTGCSRRIDQDTTAGARQCRYSNNTYYANGNPDYCGLSCPSGILKGVSSCPAVTTTPPTSAAINPADQNSVNSAYKTLWAAGVPVATGWSGNAATCSPGNITQAAVTAQANAVNFARQINGLGPVSAVALSDANQANVQRAAVIMEANGALNHNPDSTWKCYTAAGATTASKSNLSLILPSTNPIAAIKSYLDEPGADNTAAGHRQWLFNPPASVFAFGMTNAASALQVIGLPQNNTANPTWVEWPSNGYFPNTLEPNGRWSISAGNSNTDFTSAAISVTYNGAAVAVTKYAPHTYAKPTLVWQMPSTISKTGTYTVTISNVKVSGSTIGNYSYSVTLFAPY